MNVHTRSVALALVLTFVALALAAHTSGGTARAGGACSDPTPNAGGELEFQGSGTPEHLAIAEGDLCPGSSETWTFHTLPVDIDQNPGVRVFEESGAITISLQTPSSGKVTLQPGEEYHGSQTGESTYEVTITGGGTGLSRYRLEVCRAIYPCTFVVGPSPPGPLSPPINLSPPDNMTSVDGSPGLGCVDPVLLSPSDIPVCLPSTGAGASTSDGWLGGATLLAGTVAALIVVIAGLSAALDRRRD